VTGSVTKQVLRASGSGELLAYSSVSGASTTTWVPLQDALGSTVALVDPAGSLATQYTYDPAGKVTTSGAANSLPYLFGGMEYDSVTGLYHTGGMYYSPILSRLVQQVVPRGSGGSSIQGTGGSLGSPGGGDSSVAPEIAGRAALAAVRVGSVAYAALGTTAGADLTAALFGAALASSEFPPAAIAIAIAAAISALLDQVFDIFGSEEPELPRERKHAGHSINVRLIGDAREMLVWSQAQLKLAQFATPTPNPPPGTPQIRKAPPVPPCNLTPQDLLELQQRKQEMSQFGALAGTLAGAGAGALFEAPGIGGVVRGCHR
jgi:YD repeat-containing protein